MVQHARVLGRFRLKCRTGAPCARGSDKKDPTLVRIMLTRTDTPATTRDNRELDLRPGDKVHLYDSSTGVTLTLRGASVAEHTWLSTDGDLLLNDAELRQLIEVLQSRLPHHES